MPETEYRPCHHSTSFADVGERDAARDVDYRVHPKQEEPSRAPFFALALDQVSKHLRHGIAKLEPERCRIKPQDDEVTRAVSRRRGIGCPDRHECSPRAFTGVSIICLARASFTRSSSRAASARAAVRPADVTGWVLAPRVVEGRIHP